MNDILKLKIQKQLILGRCGLMDSSYLIFKLPERKPEKVKRELYIFLLCYIHYVIVEVESQSVLPIKKIKNRFKWNHFVAKLLKEAMKTF